MTFSLPKANNVEFTLVPPGLYVMRLKEMQGGIPGNPDFADKDGNVKNRVRWVFTIEDVIDAVDEDADEFIGEEFWAFTSETMGRKATMRAWVEALLGREVEEDDDLTNDDLVGKTARCTVIHYQKMNGDTGHKISSMLKAKPAKKRRRKADDDFDVEPDEGDEFD